jgi:hypothetical protein
MAGYESIGLALGGQRAQVTFDDSWPQPVSPTVLCVMSSRCPRNPRSEASFRTWGFVVQRSERAAGPVVDELHRLDQLESVTDVTSVPGRHLTCENRLDFV